MSSGVFRLPVSSHLSAKQLLEAVQHEDLHDVLIIGYDAEGHLFIRSNKMTCAEAVFMASSALQWALNGGDPEDEDEDGDD